MTRTILVIFVLVVSACAAAPKKQRGLPCELSSECDAPLVCRLGACRKECATTRDCAAPAQCVVDADGLGACELEAELHCAVASDCAAPLVCASTRCVNACAEDRDCPPGASCVDHGCVDPSAHACVRDSECVGVTVPVAGGPALTTVCAVDGRCRVQCDSSRECRYGTECDPAAHVCLVPGTAFDAGVHDGGMTDGGMTDGGATCPGTSSATDVAVSETFVCAIVGGGSVACWGALFFGQGGAVAPADRTPVPVVVPGITDAVQLAVSQSAVCAIHGTARTVACWGGNSYGELGTGASGSGSPTPTDIPSLTGVAQIAAGPWTFYAVLATGAAYAWGDSQNGAIGDGSLVSATAPPTPVTFARTVDEIRGTTLGACLRSGGAVHCWGQNDVGKIGDAMAGPRALPQATPITDAVALGAGETAICAERSSGIVSCWGSDIRGALGDGTPSAAFGTPTDVLSASGGALERPAFGVYFGCATGTGGTPVYCWGANDSGALGIAAGDTDAPSTPVMTASGPLTATRLSLGAGIACALAPPDVYCWGGNGSGQLGIGTLDATPHPTATRVACLP